MTRGLLSLSVCAGALVLAIAGAGADELPTRKAGLWEMKVLKAGSQAAEMTMQHCTDAATDKDMADSVSPLARQVCTRRDVVKTATGYVTDSVCTVAGVSVTSHSEITGDFNSAYTVMTRAHLDKGADQRRDTTTTIEAKWLGDCKAGQKPGDIVMPGGFKFNVKDAGKLKGALKLMSPKTN
jgi:hypothetical protein